MILAARLLERIQGGMMYVTGLYGEGRLGRPLFAVRYLTRFAAMMLLAVVVWTLTLGGRLIADD